MNLDAIIKCWESENTTTDEPKRERIQPYTTYTKSDIENFISDIRGGKKKAKAGRDNGIPNGSVYHLSRTAGL
tara:strand:- start:7109 stop:7327 length:219 start_codon:yes stop_codon:yes gene_type:complete